VARLTLSKLWPWNRLCRRVLVGKVRSTRTARRRSKWRLNGGACKGKRCVVLSRSI
jgi:hypothetical protein